MQKQSYTNKPKLIQNKSPFERPKNNNFQEKPLNVVVQAEKPKKMKQVKELIQTLKTEMSPPRPSTFNLKLKKT
mgnify:CR=1 FL=1|jgi:hypothetical protein